MNIKLILILICIYGITQPFIVISPRNLMAAIQGSKNAKKRHANGGGGGSRRRNRTLTQVEMDGGMHDVDELYTGW